MLKFLISGVLFLTHFSHKLVVDRILRTRLHTGAAADTFRMVRRFQDIDIHLARRNAALASDAFITLDLDAEKGYLVKERVDRPQRADPFAERAIKHKA